MGFLSHPAAVFWVKSHATVCWLADHRKKRRCRFHISTERIKHSIPSGNGVPRVIQVDSQLRRFFIWRKREYPLYTLFKRIAELIELLDLSLKNFAHSVGLLNSL